VSFALSPLQRQFHRSVRPFENSLTRLRDSAPRLSMLSNARRKDALLFTSQANFHSSEYPPVQTPASKGFGGPDRKPLVSQSHLGIGPIRRFHFGTNSITTVGRMPRKPPPATPSRIILYRLPCIVDSTYDPYTCWQRRCWS
jgi:hypothetical protein